MAAAEPSEQRDACPGCGGRRLYVAADVSAGGGYAPKYLPGLGFLYAATLDVVACVDCGLMRLFASREARKRIPTSSRWRPV